jgi:hypothetical protein
MYGSRGVNVFLAVVAACAMLVGAGCGRAGSRALNRAVGDAGRSVTEFQPVVRPLAADQLRPGKTVKHTCEPVQDVRVPGAFDAADNRDGQRTK